MPTAIKKEEEEEEVWKETGKNGRTKINLSFFLNADCRLRGRSGPLTQM